MRVSNFRLGIGVPCNFPMISAPMFDSFITMEKPDYLYLRAFDGKIENMRNQIGLEALQARCTHVWMGDADQVYPSDTLTRLLAHRLPIVGCRIYRRYPPFDPLLMRGTIGGYIPIPEEELPSSGLVEVDATGTGCLLINTEILRTLPYPWFRFRRAGDGSPVGEDFGFCADAKAHGYRIFVDAGIIVGHLTQLVVNDGTHKLFKRVKEAELKAMQPVEHGATATT